MALKINRKMLTWARERNGLSVEDLARAMKREPSEILSWEDGVASPTYACLEELAYRHFKLTLAVFFFPTPPDIDDPVKKFRRLPDYEFARLSPETFQTIRLAQAYQESLSELLVDEAPGKVIVRDLERVSIVGFRGTVGATSVGS